MMVQGLPKTEASAKRCFVGFGSCRFSAEMETVQSVQPPIASSAKQKPNPMGSNPTARNVVATKPTAGRAGIQKRLGFHTFRHTYTTLLTQNNEDVKVVQELLCHANSRIRSVMSRCSANGSAVNERVAEGNSSQFNSLDFSLWFGTRRSKVQILSPRPVC